MYYAWYIKNEMNRHHTLTLFYFYWFASVGEITWGWFFLQAASEVKTRPSEQALSSVIKLPLFKMENWRAISIIAEGE